MKKALFLIPVLTVAFFTLAQQINPPENTNVNIPTTFFGCTGNETLTKCLLKVFSKILQLILVVALIFATGFGAYAGIVYITSPDKKEEAKNRLIYAALGLVVSFLAWTAVSLLAKFITGGNI